MNKQPTSSRQRFTDEEILNAVEEHGSQRKAARALGMNTRTLERRLKRLTLRGHSPKHDMTKMVPEGFTVLGTSTLYDKEGNLVQQWVKSKQDAEAIAAMMEAMLEGMKEEIPRAPARVRPQRALNDDLMNLYVLTDYHLGMLAWGEETGDDWDTAIAEKTLVRWFEEAIAASPNAEVGVLAQLGDFLHWDGIEAVTPTSGHVLDADTRFQKLIRVAIRVLRRVVQMLLDKHDRVHLVMAEGNHDIASSMWLREWMAVHYEDDPRITVDTSADPYYCYEHGLTSLFFHHGHKRKPSNIDTVFAAKFRKVFGRTEFSYGHMGHLHHNELKETSLMTIEQHRTLAASDAHASRGGWMSGRDAKVITYSKRFGEAGRVTIPISRVMN